MTETPAILLVDDQERNLDALEAILHSAEYRLERARSADEALLALLKRDFAAIVCDIQMPGTSGLELARMVKLRRRTQHIPIVFLTAHSVEEADLLKGYNVGAVDYLTKPLNPEVLRLKLAVFVDLFKKTRALAGMNAALAEEVAQRQQAQEALAAAKQDLERRVEERTRELVVANRALRESEERMVLAMEGASMGIFWHDLRSGQVRWSEVLEGTFGLAPGTFSGSFEDFLARVYEPDRRRIAEAIQNSRGSDARFTLEFRFRRDDDPPGEFQRWMHMVSRFVFDESGRRVHCVGVTADITAQRQAADELRRLKESAEAANRAKDQFLAVLSHELRTPLTPVLAMVQSLLLDNAVPSDIRPGLEMISRNVELEARLIDDLLDLTRIARGKLELHSAPVNVHEVIEHALRTCEADFRANQIDVRVSLDARQTSVMGDRARLLQVFWNLLKNAAKFSLPGHGVHVRTFDLPGDTLAVEVSDNGIGIEPAQLSTIFNAFEQGDPKVTRRYGGLGLGLSIGKALVEMHNGSICAASPGVGKGACFTVRLPAHKPAHVAAAAGPTASTGALPSPNPSPDVRLLVVEDHADTLRVLKRLLRSMGYDVTVAGAVAEALRAFEAEARPFDVVISDIGLPDGSGWDLIRQIHARWPGIPAIALSGFGMEEDRSRSLEAGFQAHLTKPVDVSMLGAAIERLHLAASHAAPRSAHHPHILPAGA